MSILAEPIEAFIGEAVLYRLDSPELARAVTRRQDKSRARTVMGAVPEYDACGLWERMFERFQCLHA